MIQRKKNANWQPVSGLRKELISSEGHLAFPSVRLLISWLNCAGSEHKTPGQATQSFQFDMKSARRAFNSLSAHNWLQRTKGQAHKCMQFHKICVKFTTTRSPFWSAVEMVSLVVLARTDITMAIAYTVLRVRQWIYSSRAVFGLCGWFKFVSCAY